MPGTILNVDNEPANRYSRGAALRKAGFKVIDAASGAEAVELSRRHLPSLVLLDVNLSDIDGVEVCRLIKSDPATKRTPVVHISAVSLKENDRVAALDAGADAYLTEPVAPEVLVSTLNAVLRLAREAQATPLDEQRAAPLGADRQPYGDLSALNTCRVILDSIGDATLREIASEYLDLLETSSAVYEKNGDYALGMFSSGWCRLLDAASRRLCGTDDDREALASGKWLCHEACWAASRRSMESGAPVDEECPGGLRLFAAPITSAGNVVGSINFGYGTPPVDPAALQEIAAKFQVPLEALRAEGANYRPRPPAMVDAARRRLLASARLIGELVHQKQAGIGATRARASAEAAADRLTRLHTIMAALVEAVTTDDVLDAIIGRVMAATGAETGIIVLAMSDGEHLATARIRGYSEEAARRLARIPADANFPVAEAYRTGEVVTVASALADERYPVLRELRPGHAGAAAAIPLATSGRVLGALGIRFAEPREFAREDVDMLRTVGRVCAEAIERARLFDSEQRARRELELSEAQRKRDEEALRESEATLRFITEASPNNIFIQDRDLRYVWVSKPIPPLEAGDYIGETDAEIWPPAEAEELTRLKRRVLEEARPLTTEITLHRGGEPRVFDAVFEPRRDASGEVVGVAGYMRDITERKAMEQQLQQAQRLESVGVLAAGIAHDFNNLLTGILGSASLLEEEYGEPRSENVSRIIASAERAAMLTRQLLAYSGKGRFILSDVNLSEFVAGMADLLRLSVPRSAQLELRLADSVPMVSADPSQMQQLVLNLVINAAEAIPEGASGCVTIRTGREIVNAAMLDATGNELAAGDYVALSVTDTGLGIAPEVRAHMFEPFYTTKFTGRGLGLAAVAGIARSQKGGVLVDSEPGRGTSFRVLLPVAGAAQTAAGPEKPVVLVVDDEEPVREFIASALSRKGYEVLIAANGREGVAVWNEARERISLAIVDVIMPVMGGGDLLAEIRRAGGRSKVLITSGYEAREAMRLCGGYEIDGFLQKPYTAARLFEVVGRILEQYPAQQAGGLGA